MRLSELIEKFTDLLDRYGDKNVVVDDGEWLFTIDTVQFIHGANIVIVESVSTGTDV